MVAVVVAAAAATTVDRARLILQTMNILGLEGYSCPSGPGSSDERRQVGESPRHAPVQYADAKGAAPRSWLMSLGLTLVTAVAASTTSGANTMAQRNRYNHKQPKHRARTPSATTLREPPVAVEKAPPTQYGQPFVLLEDESKNTFEYQGGKWVPHSMSIAECRQSCQVKELPQKVNRMTRYEVRSPV